MDLSVIQFAILKKEDFFKICRCCLTECDHICSIFQIKYEDVAFVEIISKVFGTEVNISDGLPKNMCEKCIAQIINFYNFKKNYDCSLEILSNIVQSTHEVPVEQSELPEQNGSIKDELQIERDKLEEVKNLTNSEKAGICNQKGTRSNTDYSILKNMCDICGKAFLLPRTLIIHKHKKHAMENNETQISTHTDNTSLPETEFLNHNAYENHQASYTEQTPVCDRFMEDKNLNITVSDDRPFNCDKCDAKFKRKSHLRRHIKLHTEVTLFICEFCGKNFIHRRNFTKHTKNHSREKINTTKLKINSNEDHHQCTLCNKLFAKKIYLKNHMLTHGEKRFLCSYCGKDFRLKTQLDLHAAIHTGEKRYSCSLCNKSFRQATQLKNHLNVHTGQRPFVCKLCPKAFKQWAHLQTHLRIHSGEKPYKCRYCNKTFSQYTSRNIHVRIHTGERPYVCDYCSKGFYHSSTMKKHKQKHFSNVQSLKNEQSFEIGENTENELKVEDGEKVEIEAKIEIEETAEIDEAKWMF